MLIGHAILNILPHTDLPIDYPLLYLYTKVGVAGGLVIGSISGLITSALLILAILASISSQSSDAKEEMDKVKRRVSAVIIGSDDGQNPSHSTQLASLSRMTVRNGTLPPQPHVETVPENESQPSQPTTTTTAQVINSGADAMSWAVAGPLGVYALQFYYDHIQPSTEMDVSSLVDPLQAGMAIGLGRIICYTFINALKRKTT
ncbi:hypothetical protein NLI96_g11261 [Meripilus lineatus]|uniref:Uncharacterized protein n=1 Tax=Meripilus lineatus TaxID=2056292 RepID=A0AAD5US28_9APHY|nr:hypothetical protein NLI96_g11261 [Physisporinus lineatus]